MTMLGPKAPLEKLVVTPAEAERMLPGFSRYRIKQGIAAGQIPSVTLGAEPLIPMTWVEHMREELLMAPKPPHVAPTPTTAAPADDPDAAKLALMSECAGAA